VHTFRRSTIIPNFKTQLLFLITSLRVAMLVILKRKLKWEVSYGMIFIQFH